MGVTVRPTWFHDLPLLEQAARCAVGCWFNIEKGLCNAVQDALDPTEVLTKKWFKYWGVVRTFSKDGDREGIRKLLFGEIPHLKAAPPNENSWKLVEELSAKIRGMNRDKCPTSLVSKFAFSCCPTTFVPYDSLVHGQLGTREHKYVEYMHNFSERKKSIDQQLREFKLDGQVGLSARNLPLKNETIMDQPLFLTRITDWYLLLRSKDYDPIKRGDPVHCDPMI